MVTGATDGLLAANLRGRHEDGMGVAHRGPAAVSHRGPAAGPAEVSLPRDIRVALGPLRVVGPAAVSVPPCTTSNK
jgi:hypothetical protein